MRRIIVDANLLVLLIVGLLDPSLIKRHKRTRTFEIEDFEFLKIWVSDYEEILVTPHILTEVSNLISQIGEPVCGQLRTKFAELLVYYCEVFEPGREIVSNKSFDRLGLTDCALLNMAGNSIPILTVDLALYLAVIERNPNAINFNHHRTNWLLKD